MQNRIAVKKKTVQVISMQNLLEKVLSWNVIVTEVTTFSYGAWYMYMSVLQSLRQDAEKFLVLWLLVGTKKCSFVVELEWRKQVLLIISNVSYMYMYEGQNGQLIALQMCFTRWQSFNSL